MLMFVKHVIFDQIVGVELDGKAVEFDNIKRKDGVKQPILLTLKVDLKNDLV